jgi:hypothetical protein
MSVRTPGVPIFFQISLSTKHADDRLSKTVYTVIFDLVLLWTWLSPSPLPSFSLASITTILYSLALPNITFVSCSASRTLWRASSLVIHLLLLHQSSSTTFTGYQFIIALTSKLLFSHTKFLPLTNLLTSLLLLISISRLGLCVALTNTSSISPEPALIYLFI